MARFMHLFNRLEAIDMDTSMQNLQASSEQAEYKYVATNVSRQIDFQDKLVSIPPRNEIETFIEKWEISDRQNTCLYMSHQGQSVLFEWILYDLFKTKTMEVLNIASEREEYTMAFSGKTIIQLETFEQCVEALSVLMDFQDKHPNKFQLARVKFNVEFPKTYSIFAIQYSLGLARVDTLMLPSGLNQKLVFFCKPSFCLQYVLMPIVGYVLGDNFTGDRDNMYEWNGHTWDTFKQNGMPVKMSSGGKQALKYHNYQAIYAKHIMNQFNIERRPINACEDSPEERRLHGIMKKLSCIAERWLYHDYGILTKIGKKEAFKLASKRPRFSTTTSNTNNFNYGDGIGRGNNQYGRGRFGRYNRGGRNGGRFSNRSR